MDNTFLVCSRNESDVEWLQSALVSVGQIVKVGDTLDEVLRLMDMMRASLIFIGVDRDNLVAQCALIEGLLEARPMLVVVAVGDGFNSELVIAAMRAGARDFITYGLRGSEVQGLVRRLATRLPQLPSRPEQGGLAVLHSARPDAEAALVAAHIALSCAANGSATLLLDLGIPSGESLAILGLEASFHFTDAMRNLRRLDSSVIESAFPRHRDGLRVLALGDEHFPLENSSSAELFLLLGTLRQNFTRIVVNLCGQRDSDILRTFVGGADELYWFIDQSVANSRRNLELLQSWRSLGVKVNHARLLVDRYIDNVAPDAVTLGRTFGLDLAATLPLSPAARLESKNQGESLFDLAPRDALSKALSRLSRGGGRHKAAGLQGLLQRALERVR